MKDKSDFIYSGEGLWRTHPAEKGRDKGVYTFHVGMGQILSLLFFYKDGFGIK